MALTKETPRVVFKGFKDDSIKPIIREPDTSAQHYPIFADFYERGPTIPVPVSSDPGALYGSKSFDPRSIYYNHQKPYQTKILGQGNGLVIQRLIPPNAKKAAVALTLEVIESTIPVWDRNADGSVKRDSQGQRIQQMNGADPVTTTGHKLRWGYVYNTEAQGGNPAVSVFELQQTTGGPMSVGGGTQSTVYPIFAFGENFGAYGNDIGVRLSAPVKGQPNEGNIDLMKDVKALIYRLQFVENDRNGTPVVQPTIARENSVDFAVKDGVYDPVTNVDYRWEDIGRAYTNVDATDGPLAFGPMPELKIYNEHINSILDLLFQSEVAAHAAAEPNGKHAINFLTGKDFDGNDHYGFVYDGGVVMGPNTVHYAQGGVDGDIDNSTLDTAVETFMQDWEVPNYELKDMLRYPISDIYDTGFGYDTKIALLKALTHRRNMYVTLSTHTDGGPSLSNIEENSLAVSMVAQVALFPESVFHGTAACRCTIVGSNGVAKDIPIRKKISMSYDLAGKRAAFGGAGSGRLVAAKSYDDSPGNIISGIVGVNNAYKPLPIRHAAWDTSLNYVQYRTSNEQFWPAIQTVYRNAGSNLNDEVNVRILCNLVLIGERIWADFVNNKQPKEVFKSEATTRFNQMVDRAYAGRMVIEPNFYFTNEDDARGWSWHFDITAYGNPARLVQNLNIITKRQSDLNN